MPALVFFVVLEAMQYISFVSVEVVDYSCLFGYAFYVEGYAMFHVLEWGHRLYILQMFKVYNLKVLRQIIQLLFGIIRKNKYHIYFTT